MGAEIGELRLLRLSDGCFKWKNNLRVAHIERVQKRLAMNQRCVIDVQRDFADECERLFSILVIEDSHIVRDQAAKRIQCQSTDRSFHAVFVQFLDEAVPPLPAKASFRQIPTPAKYYHDCNEN